MNPLTSNKLIYFASFLVFPFLGILIYWLLRRRANLFLIICLMALSILFIWARFIEPQIILVRQQKIDIGFSGKIALIADIHAGIYKNEKFIKRVVAKINQQQPEVILIAGDFLYACDDVNKYFSSLTMLKAPVYAVLGNHDFYSPNCPRVELIEALTQQGVKILDNSAMTLPNFTLLGLSDYMFGRDGTAMLNNYTQSDNLIVMTHNPDTILNYPNKTADLTVCGHTHGGQVRIPWIYKHVIPTQGDFDQGLTQEKNTQLFITSGLGEYGLPLRFLNPPAIDTLELK